MITEFSFNALFLKIGMEETEKLYFKKALWFLFRRNQNAFQFARLLTRQITAMCGFKFNKTQRRLKAA